MGWWKSWESRKRFPSEAPFPQPRETLIRPKHSSLISLESIFPLLSLHLSFLILSCFFMLFLTIPYLKRLNLKELVTTETELKAMAAAAIMGFNNMPKKG
jgi:hypothetical protein